MKHFEATVHINGEYFENNDPKQGLDPDTQFFAGDFGVYTGQTTAELIKTLKNIYDLSTADFFENRVETAYLETDSEGVKYLETMTIFLNEVETKDLDAKKLFQGGL